MVCDEKPEKPSRNRNSPQKLFLMNKYQRKITEEKVFSVIAITEALCKSVARIKQVASQLQENLHQKVSAPTNETMNIH